MNKVDKKNIVLEGKKICKVFNVGLNTIEVLKGVDVTIQKGEFIVLFGASGCGKSTLLNILLGLEVPTSGNVFFMDQDLYQYDEDHRSKIRKDGVGLIYQQQNWIKSMNVIENVAFPLLLKGIPFQERMDKAMEKLVEVGMEKSALQATTELSSGQQQRVSFARALISNPALVVADEPTGNLDSKSGLALMQLFADYNQKGNTIIMVTHDLGFLDYATRSINMSDGIIVNEYLAGDPELDKYKILSRKK